MTAIDAEKGTVAGTIPLEGKLEFGAADGKGHVYVDGEDKNVVFDMDSKKLTLAKTWPLAPCEEPIRHEYRPEDAANLRGLSQ